MVKRMAEKEEVDRFKIFRMRNKKTNCGLCVCLLDTGPDETPEDIVSLCMGEYKGQVPEHQILMTVDEAHQAGLALIKAKLMKEIEEAVKA